MLSSPHNDKKKSELDDYALLSKRHRGHIEPLHRGDEKAVVFASEEFAREKLANPAVTLIRSKLKNLYAREPKAEHELSSLKKPPEPEPRSKHQQYMYDLSTSGRSLAEIQTAWHNYYVGLPDEEKHQVWQEFYETSARRQTPYSRLVEQHQAEPKNQQTHARLLEPAPPALPHRPRRDSRTARVIKKQILDRVSLEAREKTKRHLRSLAFGLSTGFVVLLIFLFGFFNEVIIAPFIQPSRTAHATPIILSTDGVAPSDRNEVIIPKINLEIPLDFSVTSTDEGAIENSLDNGVVHYPTTSRPGEQGNAAFFGHSSNNIFNKGNYKFAFVLLRTLEVNDIFYLTYNGRVYSYKVFDKKVVAPNEVSVLNPVPGKGATATLITCDPPGTSLHRLVVWGEQVSPDPNANAAAAAPTVTTGAKLPADGPTLWGRFIHWLTH